MSCINAGEAVWKPYKLILKNTQGHILKRIALLFWPLNLWKWQKIVCNPQSKRKVWNANEIAPLGGSGTPKNWIHFIVLLKRGNLILLILGMFWILLLSHLTYYFPWGHALHHLHLHPPGLRFLEQHARAFWSGGKMSGLSPPDYNGLPGLPQSEAGAEECSCSIAVNVGSGPF